MTAVKIQSGICALNSACLVKMNEIIIAKSYKRQREIKIKRDVK